MHTYIIISLGPRVLLPIMHNNYQVMAMVPCRVLSNVVSREQVVTSRMVLTMLRELPEITATSNNHDNDTSTKH